MKKAKAAVPVVMDLVAGPQGSGKSTFFRVQESGHDAFNIDAHRKRLNRGSAQKIPLDVQKKAAADYEAFIEGHIRMKRSFSIEVTLGKEVTFEQAVRAHQEGFSVQLTYIAANLDDCIERVAKRVERGGHGVKLGVLQKTHAASMRNLARAIQEFDIVRVYDNSRRARLEDDPDESGPRLVLEAECGEVTFRASNPPRWLKDALDE